MTGERPVNLPSAKLRSAIGVQNANRDVTSPGGGHFDRGDHVMSDNQSWLGAVAVKSRLTKSSCDGAPALAAFERFFLPNTDHHW